MRDHRGPGFLLTSDSHAAEVGLGRLRDELEFVRAHCRDAAIPFDPEAFWRIHASEIALYRPPTMGRPRRGQKARRPEPPIVGLNLHTELVDWATAHAQPDGPFDARRPLPHAVDTGLRVLRAAGFAGPSRAAGFLFDGDDLRRRYLFARR